MLFWEINRLLKFLLEIRNFIMSKQLTKSDLEQIISLQQESLQAMQKVLGSLRNQNESLERSNQKLRKRISEYE